MRSGPQFGEPNGGEIGGHVGLEIGGRVEQLVEKLLLAGSHAEAAARADDLGEHRRAVFRHLGDREAETGEIGNVLVAGIGEIAAGDLTRAFQEMPDDRALAQQIPIVERPAELMDKRREKQRGIAHTSCDHDIGAAPEGLQDAGDAHIRVGRQNGVAERGDVARTLEQGVVARSHDREHVVAGDGRDPQAAEAEASRHLGCGERCPRGVGRAHVRDDARAFGCARPEHGLHTRPQ